MVGRWVCALSGTPRAPRRAGRGGCEQTVLVPLLGEEQKRVEHLPVLAVAPQH